MFSTEDKNYYVSKVREGSPAEIAGILEKDEIMTVNKIPIDFWELSDLVKLFRSEPQKEIYLQIKRHKKESMDIFEILDIQFQLKKQI
jgi:C-terminal processing protease CtpA/Prc